MGKIEGIHEMIEKTGKFLLSILEAFILFVLANFPTLSCMGVNRYFLLLLIPLFFVINVFPNVFHFKLLTGTWSIFPGQQFHELLGKNSERAGEKRLCDILWKPSVSGLRGRQWKRAVRENQTDCE